jgi:PAS domain
MGSGHIKSLSDAKPAISIKRKRHGCEANVEVACTRLANMTETLNMRERKVRDLEGREYSLRVRPYRNIDNKIDGAVITLVDLEAKKET